jgi:hypothetical protein
MGSAKLVGPAARVAAAGAGAASDTDALQPTKKAAGPETILQL